MTHQFSLSHVFIAVGHLHYPSSPPLGYVHVLQNFSIVTDTHMLNVQSHPLFVCTYDATPPSCVWVRVGDVQLHITLLLSQFGYMFDV